MAYDGQRLSPDGTAIAYNPLAPAFSFDFTNYVSWGNYRGGRAGAIWLTTLPSLDSTEIPHEQAADFSPVFLGGKVYFLSGRHGRVGVFAYDPATKAVTEVWHNDTDSDVRSLSSDGQTLVFDRLGELYTLTPGGTPQRVQADVAGDLPDVRARILSVSDEIENVGVSPTGLRAVVEAHGEILTVPLKHGSMRNLTNTPGVMEREPAWSPDGQSVAYFSGRSRPHYALHVASQTGAREDGPMAVRKYKLAAEPAYYFAPLWSPDSKKVAFTDNRLNTYVLDLATGKLTRVGEPDVFGGFHPGDPRHGLVPGLEVAGLPAIRRQPHARADALRRSRDRLGDATHRLHGRQHQSGFRSRWEVPLLPGEQQRRGDRVLYRHDLGRVPADLVDLRPRPRTLDGLAHRTGK